MRKLFMISAILGIVALTSNPSNAQVNINLNIGSQPAWIPAGYQSVNYYYIPEVQSYYYVPQRQFVYLNGNRWTRSRYLPGRYRNYNLHSARKVVVYGHSPYRSYNVHRTRYGGNTHIVRSSYGGRPVRYSAPRNRNYYRAVERRSLGIDRGRPGHGPGSRGHHGRQ